jgi:hypothetical protein
LLTNHPRGSQPVHLRHGDIEQNELRLQLPSLFDRVDTIDSLAAHTPALTRLDQSPQAVAEKSWSSAIRIWSGFILHLQAFLCTHDCESMPGCMDETEIGLAAKPAPQESAPNQKVATTAIGFEIQYLL